MMKLNFHDRGEQCVHSNGGECQVLERCYTVEKTDSIHTTPCPLRSAVTYTAIPATAFQVPYYSDMY